MVSCCMVSPLCVGRQFFETRHLEAVGDGFCGVGIVARSVFVPAKADYFRQYVTDSPFNCGLEQMVCRRVM